ncbi:MAG: hypothetical protein EA352_01430 [Gemmatimonadales bacterium]|nr:MAG: hypothetical protein EA352_01430 [Gemmatimonadales bacterium]
MNRYIRGGVASFVLAGLVVLSGCEETVVSGGSGGGVPAPPRDLAVDYWAGAVDVSWSLDSRWAGEPFRVYSRQAGHGDWRWIAEVTSCSSGQCSYRDRNVEPRRTYEYFVSAVDPGSGEETASEYAMEVHVPDPVPPPVPAFVEAVPLDGAIYLRWDDRAREADDFLYYRVYLEGGEGEVVLLGETDSEGFLDLVVENGSTYGYFVTSVDDRGHESDGSALAEGTPRPDYHGEVLLAWEDDPSRSGFRFQEDESVDPVLPGDDSSRDFRMERDSEGVWLVPAPGVEVHSSALPTTALRCGPAADAGCVDVRVAPSSGWGTSDMGLAPGFSYVVRVPVAGGQWQYGVLRVSHVGGSQDGSIVIFDWAFQLQPGNPALSPVNGGTGPR